MPSSENLHVALPPVRKIGIHEVRVEHDLVNLRLRGAFRLPEAIAVHEILAEVLASTGRVFVLVNSSGSEVFSPEVRRFIAEWNRDHKVTAAGIYGSSMILRGMLTLVLSAIAIFRKSALPTALVATEAEAYAFLEEQRRKFLAREGRSD